MRGRLAVSSGTVLLEKSGTGGLCVWSLAGSGHAFPLAARLRGRGSISRHFRRALLQVGSVSGVARLLLAGLLREGRGKAPQLLSS